MSILSIEAEHELTQSVLSHVAGLREVILEEGDKTVWVSKKQLEQLMDQLAE